MRQSAALLVAAATSVLAFPAVQASAATAGNILYVNHVYGCSDDDGGTEAHPFCSISAAAAVVMPGQTVKVVSWGGSYLESVKVTHSGTPEKPITFLGVTYDRTSGTQPKVYAESPTDSAFVLAGVHDVAIRGFFIQGPFRGPVPVPAVVVSDSSRVTLDQNEFAVAGLSVQTTGDTGQLTVSRNKVRSSGGVNLGAGTHDALITGNEFSRDRTVAITATDAPNTAVTYNTIAFSCGEGLRIDGASPGALVENNVITAEHKGSTDAPAGACANTHGEAEIAVSAGSVSGSKIDYNLVHPFSDGSAYAWDGRTYPSAAAFAAATGQAGHDVDLDVAFRPSQNSQDSLELGLTEEAAAAIDSADPDAPGVDTDINGVKPGDDPNIPNTAPNGGVRDRGAYELHGQRSPGLTVTADVPTLQGPAPFTVKAATAPVNVWGVKQVNYHFDFGDGTTQDSTDRTLTHTYTTPGTYWVRILATDAQGAQAFSDSKSVAVKAPDELSANFSFQEDEQNLAIKVFPFAMSPYVISSMQVDFGDGTVVPVPMPFDPFAAPLPHQYSAPGFYQISVTATDQGGRTTTYRPSGIWIDRSTYLRSIAPGERVQLFTQRTDGTLINGGANYTNGVWGPFVPLPSVSATPGKVTATAAVMPESNDLLAYTLVNGKVYENTRFLNQNWDASRLGTWDQWREVTATPGAGPLAGVSKLSATAIGNTVHLMAVANSRVYETYRDQNTGIWRPWGDVTAAAGLPANVTDVAVSSIGKVLHVAMLGSDGRVRIADGDYNVGRWSGGDLTAAIGSPGTVTQLATAATPGSKFHVVARTSDGRVFEATADYAAGRWGSWGNISAETGLPSVQQVAVASTGNSLRVFGVVGGNSVLNANGDYTAGRWSAAARVDTPGAAGPLDPFEPSMGIGPLTVAGR